MPITVYRCAKCRREYEKSEDAAACERGHAEVKQARAKQYTLGHYPFTLEVTFSDDATKIYVLEDMAHTL